MKPCIYVEGPYSASNFPDVLENMRRVIRVCIDLKLDGYSPFCPWLDFQYALMVREDEGLTLDDYRSISIAWMLKADAVLMLDGWERSNGARHALDVANERDMRVCFSRETLDDWRDNVWGRKT